MKPLKALATLASLTLAMGIASPSFANPTVTTTATQTTTVTKVPTKKVVKHKAKTSRTGFTCKDGSHSKAKSTRGACSGHGGIAK